MIPSSARSPDLEGGTKRRKAPPPPGRRAAQAQSEPARAQAVSQKIFARSPFAVRWTHLMFVLTCLSLVSLLRLTSLPLLPNGISRTLVPWMPEPDHKYNDQKGKVYSPNQVDLDRSSTRLWGSPVSSRPARPNPLLKFAAGSDRRFLTFLSHSGFNNQRIALENAIMLAYILNCTLVAPPVRLGSPLPYRPFNTLERHHLISAKKDAKECDKFKSLKFTPPECVEQRHFTLMPWSELVDLQPLQDRFGLDILFIHGSETPRHYLEGLGLPKEAFAFLKDEELYHYRVYDSQHSFGEVQPDSKYRDELHVDSLRTMIGSFPVIHFGTLFGSGRLKLRQPEHIAVRSEISRAMKISHGTILETAHTIRTRIAQFGADGRSYLAVHVRVGDRKFKGTSVKTGRAIWWQLISRLGISEATGVELERRFLRMSANKAKRPLTLEDPITKDPIKPWFNNSKSYEPHARCASPHEGLGIDATYLGLPLFIASDSSHPRTDSALAIFHATFPCTFVLSDFSDELESLIAFHRTGTFAPMGRFFIPLVDAVIAGYATHVIGTPSSTFSNFVTGTLHPAYSKDP